MGVQAVAVAAMTLYASLGWSTLPVSVETKRPLIPWKTFQRRPPTPDEVFGWSRRFDGQGIAVVTGPVSRIVVLDADGDQGRAEAVRNGIPKTPMANTPSGGLHAYFRLPEGLPAFKNSTKLGESRAIDVRGHEAYVVAPFTVRPDGRRYEWMEDPRMVPLAEPPAWFIRMLVARVKTSKANPMLQGDLRGQALVAKLSATVQRFVLEGHDLTIYPSRSECDRTVIAALCSLGADRKAIAEIFADYPIGEKFREQGSSGLRYIERTMEFVLQRIRIAKIKYADYTDYGDAQRLHLNMTVVSEGEDEGRLIRSGVTVPKDGASLSLEKRWRSVFDAARVPISEDVRAACARLVGKEMRLEVDMRRNNPVVSFNPV